MKTIALIALSLTLSLTLSLVPTVLAVRKRIPFDEAPVPDFASVDPHEFVLNRAVGPRLHGVWRVARRSRVPVNETLYGFDPNLKIHNVTASDFIVRHDSTLSIKRLRQFAESVLRVDDVRFKVFGGDARDVARLDQVVGIWPLPLVQTFTVETGPSAGHTSFAEQNNVTIAVADTGLDVNHCSFYDTHDVSYSIVPIVPASTNHRKIKRYYSVCTESSVCTATDRFDARNGHGTHVSAIAAAQECSSHVGVHSGSRVVFFDLQRMSNSEYIELPASVETWLDTAKKEGVRVMFLSFGSECSSAYNDLAAQIDRWLWLNPEMSIVVAAGNCGAPGARYKIACPACAKNVVSVGAAFLGAEAYKGRNVFSESLLTNSPHLFSTRTAATFSSPGPMRDGRVAPLVAAPGVAVSAAAANPNGGPNHVGFIAQSGTSMACPYTPIGHIFTDLRRFIGHDPPNYMVRAAAVLSAEKCTHTSTPFLQQKLALDVSDDPALRCGFGTVRFRPLDESHVVIQDQVGQGEMDTRCFVLNSGRVVLAWNDRDSAFSSRVIDSLSLVTTWNDGDKRGKWNTNVVDNTKRIDLEFHEPTLVKIMVAAQHQLTESKPYALIVSGVVSEEICPTTKCDDGFEPTVVCAIPNGKGLLTCIDEQETCAPQSCDDGFELARDACIERNFDDDVLACPSHLHFNGTACVCSFDLLCPDGSLNECVDGVVRECERLYALPGGPNVTVADPAVVLTITSATLSVSWLFFGLLIFTFFAWELFVWRFRTKIEKPTKQPLLVLTEAQLFEYQLSVHSVINFFMFVSGLTSIALFCTGNEYGIALYAAFFVFYAFLVWHQTYLSKSVLVWNMVAYDLLVWIWVSVPLLIISVNLSQILAWVLLIGTVVYMLCTWLPAVDSKYAAYVALVVAVVALAMMVYTIASPGASTDTKIAAGIVLGFITVATVVFAVYQLQERQWCKLKR